MLARALPFSVYIAFVAASPWLVGLAPGFDARWFYALKIAAVCALLIALRRHYTELFGGNLLRWMGNAQPLLAALVGGLVFVAWIFLDRSWLAIGHTAGFDPRAEDGSLDWPLTLIRILGSAAVVPLMEELFWRSWLMRAIDGGCFWRYPPQAASLSALVLSSVVFGFEHRLWFAGIIAGLAFGALYRRSGNLWSPVIAHAVTNLALGLWVLATGNWQFW